MEVKTTKGKTSKMEDKQNWKWKMTKMEITYMVDNLNDKMNNAHYDLPTAYQFRPSVATARIYNFININKPPKI